METKYITIPFDLERAKRISNGEEEGKIVTRDGKEVRIICFDVKNDKYPIIGLVKEGDKEAPETFKKNGIYTPDEKECEYDLFLSVPEWTTFKDGDIVTMGWEDGDHYCKWISIIKVIDVFDNDICTRDYVALCIQEDENNSFSIEFDCESDSANWVRKSNEDEINKLMEGLKESKDPRAKEYLKRFFGEEEKKECEFKPFDKVLVRDDDGDHWRIDLFAREEVEFTYRFICMVDKWKQCLPYNDQTAHLLGTSNDPE